VLYIICLTITQTIDLKNSVVEYYFLVATTDIDFPGTQFAAKLEMLSPFIMVVTLEQECGALLAPTLPVTSGKVMEKAITRVMWT
jgi:hypothetical protein